MTTNNIPQPTTSSPRASPPSHLTSFFFNDTAPTEIYTLSLHDALPILLSQIGAGEIPSIRVFNKIDRLEVEPHLDRDESGTVQSVWISAARGQGLDLLGRAVAERLSRAVHRMRVQLPLSEGAARARLYAAGVVLDEQPSAEAFDLTVDLPDSELEAIGRMPGAKLVPVSGDTLKSAGKTHRRQSGWR